MENDAVLFQPQHSVERHPPIEIGKGYRDLVVLRYMARRVLTMLQQPDGIHSVLPMKQPLLYQLQERHKRTHRIALYQTPESFELPNLLFVGFISKKQSPLHPQVTEDIVEVDKKLLIELIDSPGLLSYSSLQFRNGNWCNLVLFHDVAVKAHLRNTATHTYAAYQLAPRYYEWIRLHNGIVNGGLAQGNFILQKTSIYTFPVPQGRPNIQNLIYP